MGVALMGLLGGFIIVGSGMLGSNRLRGAAGLVVSAVRLSVAHANTTGHSARIVFDLETDRLWIEETEDRMLRVKDDGAKDSEGAAAGAKPADEAEQRAIEYAEQILKGPRAPRAAFKPIDKFADKGEDGQKKAEGRELGAGVHFRQVQSEHDSQPREKGRAYLYFWPGGGTERAAIQLIREGDDEGLTVLVSPLTGRARIERGPVDLETPEYDFGQREAE